MDSNTFCKLSCPLSKEGLYLNGSLHLSLFRARIESFFTVSYQLTNWNSLLREEFHWTQNNYLPGIREPNLWISNIPIDDLTRKCNHTPLSFYYISDDDAKVTLGEVLFFVTGADVPPSVGFGRIPVITFTNQTLPTADTCYPALYLPTVHGSYEKFKETMNFSILNSPCFGNP